MKIFASFFAILFLGFGVSSVLGISAGLSNAAPGKITSTSDVSPQVSAPVRNAEGFRVVRVGLYENKPKIYTDEKGDPAGIFVVILNVAGFQIYNAVWSVQECLVGVKLIRCNRNITMFQAIGLTVWSRLKTARLI